MTKQTIPEFDQTNEENLSKNINVQEYLLLDMLHVKAMANTELTCFWLAATWIAKPDPRIPAGRAKNAVPTNEKMTVIHLATGFCGEKSP